MVIFIAWVKVMATVMVFLMVLGLVKVKLLVIVMMTIYFLS